MTYFQAYLLTRLDPFLALFSGLATIVLILIIINFIAQLMALVMRVESYGEAATKNNSLCKKVASYFKITVPLFIVILTIKSLIPTTKEAAFIYVAPAIVNNQDLQKTIKKLPELSGLGLEYLGEILKQEIKDAKGEVINEVKKSIK